VCWAIAETDQPRCASARTSTSSSSLALDLMEAVRPAVDAYLLALLTERTLRGREFVETRDGCCRIIPRLAEQLAST